MIGQPTGNSVFASGSAVAPGAGAAVCTLAAGSLPAGLYHVLAYGAYGATAGGDSDMAVKAGATTLVTLPIDAVINGAFAPAVEFVRSLDGATALTVNSVAGGGAGSVYKAVIVATPIRS